MVDLEKFQKIIGVSFKDVSLLELALTHSSYANEAKKDKELCNERLEFLGDAVLELSSSDFLFKTYLNKPEGYLTKLRASLVCEQSLAYSARKLELGEYLLLSKGEEQTGGRGRDSILSDAFEAVIGAIYLDQGLSAADKFIKENVLTDVENRHIFVDAKSVLQEMTQEKKQHLSYFLVDETGPDHNKVFTVKAVINGHDMGYGKGNSKKKAEQDAAYNAIMNLKNK